VCRRICLLCQQTSLENMNMTSNCDVRNSAHQTQMTTICHRMKPPMKSFCVRHCLSIYYYCVTYPIHSHVEVTIVNRYMRQSVTCDVLGQGSPNYGMRAKSGRRRHFFNNEAILYKKLVDLVECNISRNNHIT